jgi:ABC-type Fe3+ transport system substrate-binding protein
VTSGRLVILSCFLALIAVPLAFRRDRVMLPRDAEQLIIITPHNELIRTEFAAAFSRWHEANFGTPVAVQWNVPGGTTEIRKMLQAQYSAALEAGRAPGGNADLMFGGGAFEFDLLKRPIEMHIDGRTRSTTVLEPVDFSDDWLGATYGPNEIGDGKLYDAEKFWFGAALSSFGIVYNRDVLADLGIDEPQHWEDLCNPRFRGWIALVNPAQSGSITSAFEAILKRHGWTRGWQILRRVAANARYFTGSSLKPPADVATGNAAAGICIDFLGRYQSGAIAQSTGSDRIGYIDPQGETTIDSDPIAMLRGAPHPQLARRFIEFILSREGQALWQFRASPGNTIGPRQFELRRLPILRSIYDSDLAHFVDRVNPYEVAERMPHDTRAMRPFIAIVFAAMAMDSHRELRDAWSAIVEHPAYPRDGRLVTAADVDDPPLKAMLERFDRMPAAPGPDGGELSMKTDEHLAKIRDAMSDETLWPPNANPRDVLRLQFGEFFADHYRQIGSD